MTSKALDRFQRHAHKGAFIDVTNPAYVSIQIRGMGWKRWLSAVVLGGILAILLGPGRVKSLAGLFLIGIGSAIGWALTAPIFPDARIIVTQGRPKRWIADLCMHPGEIERLELSERYVPAEGLWLPSEHDWSLFMRLKSGERIMIYKVPQKHLEEMHLLIAELVKRWQVPVEMPNSEPTE